MADLKSSNYAALPVGEVIKPFVSEMSVREITQRLYGLEVITMEELNSYDDRNYFIKVKQQHCNPYIINLHKYGYVVKILNTMDSKNQEYIDAMQELIMYAGEHGIETSMPVKSISGKLNHLEEIPMTSETNKGTTQETKAYVVRLFTFVPGLVLLQVPYTPRICFGAGKYVGLLDRTIKNFHHKFFDHYSKIWSLESLTKLSDFEYAVTDENDRKMVNEIIAEFQETIIPNYDRFQRGMIHGDCNEQNILVRETNQSQNGSNNYEVCGLIDFADATLSYIVFEIAISICHIMAESKVIEPLDAGGHMLAGYLSEVSLNDIEMDSLKTCVAGRFCQLLVMGAYTYSLDSTNDYILTTTKRGWPCLREIWSTPNAELKSRWNKIISSYKN